MGVDCGDGCPDKATSNVYHAETGVLDTKVHKRGRFSLVITNLRFGIDECCGKYFNGRIDEVIIYDYALDTEAILKHGSRGVSVERVGKLTTRWAFWCGCIDAVLGKV